MAPTEPGCEWVDTQLDALELPPLPSLPSLPSFEFKVPPLPRLLPRLRLSLEQLESRVAVALLWADDLPDLQDATHLSSVLASRDARRGGVSRGAALVGGAVGSVGAVATAAALVACLWRSRRRLSAARLAVRHAM